MHVHPARNDGRSEGNWWYDGGESDRLHYQASRKDFKVSLVILNNFPDPYFLLLFRPNAWNTRLKRSHG